MRMSLSVSAGMVAVVGTGGPLGFDGAGPEWVQAEHMSARFMRDLGFVDARVTQQTSDGGVDVIASNAVAQVKYQAAPVGRPAVQNIRGVAFDGRQPLVYSWSGFSPGAVAFANDAQVALFHVTVSGPVPITSAARVLVEAVDRTRQRKLDEARAAVAVSEQKRAQAEAARESAERSAKQAEAARQKAQAEAQRAREAERKARDKAQRRAELIAARSEKEQRRDARRAERAAQQELARGASAERRALLGNDLVQRMRLAMGLAVLGLFCPFGISVVSFVLALRARASLGEKGVSPSPRILRATVALSAVGTAFTGLVLTSIGVQAVDPLPAGELPDWSGGVFLAVLFIVPIVMLVIWKTARTRPSETAVD